MSRWITAVALFLSSCGPVGQEPLRTAWCTAETRSARLHFDEMQANNDYMPVQSDPQGTRYLGFTIECQNLRDRQIEVTLDHAFVSIVDGEHGEVASLPSIEFPDGKESGVRYATLPPGSVARLRFRGCNVYPGVGEGRRLTVTLCFKVDGDPVWLRRSCPITISQ